MAKKKTMREWLGANIDKHKSKAALYDAAEKAGYKRRTVSEVYVKYFSGKKKDAVVNQGVTMLTEEDLRLKYDYLYMIRQGVKALADGRYVRDQEFRDMCGVPSQYWKRYCDAKEFDAYKLRAPGNIVYWTTEASAKRMRDQSILI